MEPCIFINKIMTSKIIQKITWSTIMLHDGVDYITNSRISIHHLHHKLLALIPGTYHFSCAPGLTLS